MARPHAGSLIRCLWFWLWALDGALAVSSLDVGPLAAGPALLLTALLASREASRGSTSGLLTGAGLPLLFVADVQRDGPGTTCYRTASSVGCDQHLNPIPWLIIGAALALSGLLIQRLSRPEDPRASSDHTPPASMLTSPGFP
jgi:hypothetical protein